MRVRIPVISVLAIVFLSSLAAGQTVPALGSLFWKALGNNIFNANPGSVGIGTPFPRATLDVNGTARVQGSLRTGQGLLIADTPVQASWNSRVPRADSVAALPAGALGGAYPSLTISPDGLPVISFYDQANARLAFVRCGDPACAANNQLTPLDPQGGEHSSIWIGADGLPIIAYSTAQTAPGELRFLKCGNPDCAAGNTIATVDTFALRPSVTVNPSGLPAIAYSTATGLKFALCLNSACTQKNTSTVDPQATSNANASLAIGLDGLPVISYSDLNYTLRVAKCANPACSNATIIVFTGAYLSLVTDTSLTIGNDGVPLIAFTSLGYLPAPALRVARCENGYCPGAETVDANGSFSNPSIAIGADGFPVIAYGDRVTGEVRIAKCGHLFCHGAFAAGNSIVKIPANPPSFLAYPSLAIGADGLPVVSYADLSAPSLKVFKCGSDRCIPNWSRR